MERFADLREKVLPLLRPYVKKVSVFGSYCSGIHTSFLSMMASAFSSGSHVAPRVGTGCSLVLGKHNI